MSGGMSNSSGLSAEVYLPSSGERCELPRLTGQPRDSHGMVGLTVCGGYHQETSSSCLSLEGRVWDLRAELLQPRWLHSVWESPSGLVLLGGYSSPRTTERIGEDGRSTYTFPLEYDV